MAAHWPHLINAGPANSSVRLPRGRHGPGHWLSCAPWTIGAYQGRPSCSPSKLQSWQRTTGLTAGYAREYAQGDIIRMSECIIVRGMGLEAPPICLLPPGYALAPS